MYIIFYIMSKIHSRVQDQYPTSTSSREKDNKAPEIPENLLEKRNRTKTYYLRNEHRIRQNSPKIGTRHSLVYYMFQSYKAVQIVLHFSSKKQKKDSPPPGGNPFNSFLFFVPAPQRRGMI